MIHWDLKFSTLQDILDCLPTMLVLLLTFTISVTLIPYVFSSVLK